MLRPLIVFFILTFSCSKKCIVSLPGSRDAVETVQENGQTKAEKEISPSIDEVESDIPVEDVEEIGVMDLIPETEEKEQLKKFVRKEKKINLDEEDKDNDWMNGNHLYCSMDINGGKQKIIIIGHAERPLTHESLFSFWIYFEKSGEQRELLKSEKMSLKTVQKDLSLEILLEKKEEEVSKSSLFTGKLNGKEKFFLNFRVLLKKKGKFETVNAQYYHSIGAAYIVGNDGNKEDAIRIADMGAFCFLDKEIERSL